MRMTFYLESLKTVTANNELKENFNDVSFIFFRAKLCSASHREYIISQITENK